MQEPTSAQINIARRFGERFGDHTSISLVAMSGVTETAEIIEAAKQCLETGVNDLAERFGLEKIGPNDLID